MPMNKANWSRPRAANRPSKRKTRASARIVEKHYAKWSKGRQERIDRYFLAAHGVSEEPEVVQ